MATFEQLLSAFVAVNDGRPPDAAGLANLRALAGSASDADAYQQVLNTADGTTALAMLSYQFFTGKSVTKAGLDYLTNSPDNASDLNDPYYARFNVENRYINFAANLGVAGSGATDFAAKYGQMGYQAFVASIYETIIGSSYARGAGVDPAAAIADVVSRQAAILGTAQSAGMITPGMTAAQIDLALKAATAGYLMSESIKSDIGAYAAAADAFLVNVANGGAVYNTDLIATYGGQAGFGLGHAIQPDFQFPTVIVTADPPSHVDVSHAFVLTTGADTFTGESLADTFTAADGTFTSGDALDGAGGTDTLTINSTSAFLSSGATVKNIETLNITGGSTVTLDASAWTGLTQVNVTSVGGDTLTAPSTANVTLNTVSVGAQDVFVNGGHDVTVAGATTGIIWVGTNTPATGAVVITRDVAGAVSAGPIAVRGGMTIDITQTASNAIGTTETNSSVQITGDAATTSVTVKAAASATASGSAAGVTANSVGISDVNTGSTSLAGKIASIDIDSYTTATIGGTGLTTLKLAHGSGNVGVNNSGLIVPINTTLGLTLNGLTGGTLSDSGVITTLNVTTGAEASTLANIAMSSLADLNIAGASQLTLASAAGMSALQTVTVSGTAGLIADLSGATLTSVDASAAHGDMTVSIDASKASYAGGFGVDLVTLAAQSVSHAVTGGGGTGDILTMDATTADLTTLTPGQISGFERLILTGATNQTINLPGLGGIADVQTHGGNGLTLSNIARDGTVRLDGAGTAYSISSGGFVGGANDAINLALSSSSGASVNFASTGITASGVETMHITTADTQATPSGAFNDAVTLLGNDFKTISVSGNAGLDLTATSTALTNVNAGGIGLGGFTYTTGAWAAAGTIWGSATGANTVDFSAATGGAITYTGGSGNDVITASNGQANHISLGEGANSVTSTGAGAMTITAGAGNDTVTLGGGNNTVNLGNGTNSFTATSGDNSYTGGSGVDTVTVGGGANHITLGSAQDRVTITAPGIDSDHFTTITGVHPLDILFLSVATTQIWLSFSLGDFSASGMATMLAAGATSTTAAASPVFSWATLGGDTYILVDSSDAVGFVGGVDQVVKLTGMFDLVTADVVGNGIRFFS